ncbi:hypothetical protein ACSYAE_11100 [Edwardsiella tarda]|uniref:hypothetical protein n=1 Tax=Edwardsiella tarda TaxID=636 RepID=UPI003F6577ED
MYSMYKGGLGFVLFFSIFLFSIQEIIPLQLPLLFLFLFLLLNFSPIRIGKKELVIFFCCFSFYFYSIIISSLFPSDLGIDFFQIRRLIIGLLLFFLLLFFLDNYYLFVCLPKILKVIILFHVSISAAQFIIYSIYNVDIDLISIFGYEQSNKLIVMGHEIYRASGLFLEPGTYALQVFLLFSTYSLIKKPSFIFSVIVSISLLMTYSIFAAMFGFLVMFYYFSSHSKLNTYRLFVLFFVFVVLAMIFCFFYWDYIYTRFFLRSDGSLDIKILAFQYWLSKDWISYIVGCGIANNNGVLIRDSSLLFNLIFIGGAVSILYILLFLWLSIRAGNMFIILAIGILLSKGDYTYITFWLLFSVLVRVVSYNCKYPMESRYSHLMSRRQH